MNRLNAERSLDKILKNIELGNYYNKICIDIDGGWGIGKTKFIENYFNKENNKYKLIYVSVFGKGSINDIEKSILVQFLPGFNKEIHSKLTKDIITDIITWFSEKVLSVKVEKYINSISIEDIGKIKNFKKDFGNQIIICLDDIERKSSNVKMDDLLGLVERIKRNFNVILIRNSKEINKDEIDVFNRYREKIIDDQVKIRQISDDIYTSILSDMGVKDNCNDIIKIYRDNNIWGRPSDPDKQYQHDKVNNLRIFIKYIELIKRVQAILGKNKLNNDIIEKCKYVIYKNNFRDNETRTLNLDKYNRYIYNAINRISQNEDVKIEEFSDYLLSISEVKQDIRKIYSSYKLNENQLQQILNKIQNKSEENDFDYFKNQDNIISIFDALNTINKSDKEIKDRLLKIAIDLYKPEESGIHLHIDKAIWNSFDEYGNEEECTLDVKEFIDNIDKLCDEKYKSFDKNKKQDAKSKKDYNTLLSLYRFNEIEEINDFEEMFDFFFEQLDQHYSEELYSKLTSLIDKTESSVIYGFFTNRIKQEYQTTKIEKYKELDSYLDRKIYQEEQDQH